jgi:hypothetical protein
VAVPIALLLGLAGALWVAWRPTPPRLGAALGCVVLLALAGLRLPLTVEFDVRYDRWVEVYAGDDPKLYVFLADIALTMVLLVTGATGATAVVRGLKWPFAAVTLLVGAVGLGGVRGAFLHPTTGLQTGAAVLALEFLLRLGVLVALVRAGRVPMAMPAGHGGTWPA